MLPKEIVEFIKRSGTKSLIVKGDPGSGKTTFSLEILSHFKDDMAILYVSSRVPDHVLVEQFPWITEIINLKLERRERKIKRDKLRRLEGLIEEGLVEEKVVLKGDELTIEVGEMLPELERIYDFVEAQKDKVPLICVDSLDGLAEKYGIPVEKIITTLQTDIVESGAGNIVFVQEASSVKNVDYLVDGVVLLKHDPSLGFWKRIMYILKLRGFPINKPKYVYTLHNGHFTSLKYTEFSLDSIKSIDVSSLEKELKKYDRYPCVNVRASSDVPREIVQVMIMAMIKNSKNSLILPPQFYPGALLKNHASQFLGKNVKIFGHGHERGDIYLEGRKIFVEISPEIIRYHGGKNSTIIISVEAVNNIYGDIRGLPQLIKDVKFNHRVFFITPDDVEIGGADKEMRIMMVEDIPVLIGDGAYAIQIEGEENVEVKLIPLA